MSRGQENEINTTAGNQNAQFNQNAQSSYNQAQGDIGNYQAQLSQFAAANPYGQGGAYQTAVNQSTANTADAASQGAAQGLQGAAVRTGQNASGAVGASEAIQEANARNLMGTQAAANANRIGQGAGYNEKVLQGSALPASLESSLSGQQAGAGNTALETQQKAGETPDVAEEFADPALQAAGKSIGSAAGAGAAGLIGCWIAAELFGGWASPKVILIRLWLNEVFRKRWYGPLVLAAYGRWGERVATAIGKPRHILWRNFFRELFDAGLVEAEVWLATREGRDALERNNRDTLGMPFPPTEEALHGE